MSTSPNYLSKNTNTVYDDTAEDRRIILEHLQEKLSEALQCSTESIGSKNLIYFTIFSEEKYIFLLNIALRTLKQFSDISQFDVLFITDTAFKSKIEQLEILQGFSYDFFLRQTPQNGIQASIQKLCIFDYAQINDYKKILFLDCDITLTQSIIPIFDAIQSGELLEVASNSMVTPALFLKSLEDKKYWFSAGAFTEENKNVVAEKNLTPFNAGQFAMLNTPRLKAHFQNVRWLQKVWPGTYFFEQGFMNDYFLVNEFVSRTAFENKVVFQNCYSLQPVKEKKVFTNNGVTRAVVIDAGKLSSFVNQVNMIDITKCTMVHFIGASLEPDIKLECVDKFLTLKNLCQ